MGNIVISGALTGALSGGADKVFGAEVQPVPPMSKERAQKQVEMGKANRKLMAKLSKKQGDVRKNTIKRFHLGNRGINRWGATAVQYYTYHNFLAEYSVLGDTSAPILNGKNRYL